MSVRRLFIPNGNNLLKIITDDSRSIKRVVRERTYLHIAKKPITCSKHKIFLVWCRGQNQTSLFPPWISYEATEEIGYRLGYCRRWLQTNNLQYKLFFGLYLQLTVIAMSTKTNLHIGGKFQIDIMNCSRVPQETILAQPPAISLAFYQIYIRMPDFSSQSDRWKWMKFYL